MTNLLRTAAAVSGLWHYGSTSALAVVRLRPSVRAFQPLVTSPSTRQLYNGLPVVVAKAAAIPHRESRKLHAARINPSGSIPNDNPPDPSDHDTPTIAGDQVRDNVDDDHVVVQQQKQQTLRWVRNVVVGLNLCPFAERPLLQNRLYVVVVPTPSRPNADEAMDSTTSAGPNDPISYHKDEQEEEAYETLVRLEVERQGEYLLSSPGTTLVVCPDLYPRDFASFMTVVQSVEDLIVDRQWTGILQVAPFHPQFQFAGSNDYQDDVDNRTNQSPFPMLHLLREDDVSRAVDQLPNQDAAVVWSRNVDLLNALAETLDPADFDAVVTRGIAPSSAPRTTSTVRATVRQLLRRFRIPLISTRQND
jgi:uncharacterized protein